MLRKVVYGYGIIVVILFVIILSTIIRYSGRNNFKPDAFKLAMPSVSGRNIISPADIPGLEGKKLVIKLDDTGIMIPDAEELISSPDDIFSAENMRLVKRNDGPLLLLSGDPSVAARTWMLLAQKGIDKVYIISGNKDEIPKNEFRPDTLIRPELPEY